jgi:hypothetical protein
MSCQLWRRRSAPDGKGLCIGSILSGFTALDQTAFPRRGRSNVLNLFARRYQNSVGATCCRSSRMLARCHQSRETDINYEFGTLRVDLRQSRKSLLASGRASSKLRTASNAGGRPRAILRISAASDTQQIRSSRRAWSDRDRCHHADKSGFLANEPANPLPRPCGKLRSSAATPIISTLEALFLWVRQQRAALRGSLFFWRCRWVVTIELTSSIRECSSIRPLTSRLWDPTPGFCGTSLRLP